MANYSYPTSRTVGSADPPTDHNNLAAFVNRFDTSVATGSSGNILKHNGTGWAASTDSGAGGDRVFVEDYGAVGNGSTNDYTAFAAATAAAGDDAWVTLQPGKIYALASPWVIPTGGKIWGYGATVKSTSTGSSDRVVVCSDVSNIRIFGLTIDGNKAAFAGVTEQRHGFHLVGVAGAVLVDVNASNCKGDGIYLGRGTSTGCTDIEMMRGRFNLNHRNACSIIDLVRWRFDNCDFTNTTGTAPQDAIDIEPNVSTNTVTDGLFRGCRMTGNTGDGVGINRLSTGVTPTVARIRFEHCIMKSNGLRGVIHSYGNRLDFIDCDVEANAGHGYTFEPTANASDINVRGGCIRDNLRNAVRTAPAATMNLTRVRVSDVDILDNSTEGSGTWEAIEILARTTFVTITGNLIANTTGGMDAPVKTADTTVTDLTLVGNRYQTLSANSLADQVASRVDTGNG